MDKQQRYDLYRFSCGPGWWPILDRILPQIMGADPDVYLYIKEKYGLLRIEMSSKKIPIEQHIAWENEAELVSSTVGECCGRPGKVRGKRSLILTLCDDCHKGSEADRSRTEDKAERNWLGTAE